MKPYPCPQCAHPFREHVVVTMFQVAGEGGIVVCSRTCPCVETWHAEGQPDPQLSSPAAARDLFWSYAPGVSA